MAIKLFKVVGALVLMSLMAGAYAASVSLVPTSNVAAVMNGDIVSFDIFADFSDIVTSDGASNIMGTGGGGFDLVFDASALQFLDATRAGLGDDFFSALPTNNTPGLLDDWVEASFSPAIVVGLVGTVSFQVLAGLGGGTTAIFLADARDRGANPSLAGFWAAFGDLSEIDVQYNSVDVTGVPVPAALWLMLSGLAALFGIRRKA